MFEKILCPIDFSPGSRRAMQLAARAATADSAELVLAHSRYMPPVLDASLVVGGGHARTGIERVRLGSVAEKIVRHAACPALVARRRA